MIDSRTEQDNLIQASKEWASLIRTGDVDLIVSYWADDAMLMPPNHKTVIGREAIADYVRQSMAVPGFSITWEPEAATISSDGNFGYLLERNVVSFKDSNGDLRTQSGKTVTIWKKDMKGRWACVVDIWNDNPPAEVQ